MGQVLPFSRSAQEVRALAAKQMEQGHALKALELLRLSHEKAPDDAETVYALAEVYAGMGCLTLSNNAFFSLIENDDYAAVSFFGLGINFHAMQIDSLAHDCFVLSLQKDPEGEHVPEAVEYLDSIDESRAPHDPLESRLQKRMERVLAAMDKGNARLATRLTRRVLSIDRYNGGVHAMRAFSLLAEGKEKEALVTARRAAKLAPDDLRAVCALASAQKAAGMHEAAHTALEKAYTQIQEPDDAQLVCQTACEMGAHAMVISLLSRIEEGLPYADEVLHSLAIAYHNTGQAEEAQKRWRLLRRIDPMDSIAAYHLAQAESGTVPEELPYTRQVPLAEILNRLETLRKWVHEGTDGLKRAWDERDDPEMLMRWGISCGETGIPQAMCSVLSTIGDEKARGVLRDVLYDVNAPSLLKHSALAALFTTGAQGPFHAIVDDRLTLVHVSRADDAAGAETQLPLAEAVARKARRMMPDVGDAAIEPLCATNAVMESGLSTQQKARAVVMAYFARKGEHAPFSSTFPAHRKVERLAGRIEKEMNK